MKEDKLLTKLLSSLSLLQLYPIVLNWFQKLIANVKALYFAGIIFAVFHMNVSSLQLEFNFADFELLRCYNVLPKRLRGVQFRESLYSSFAKLAK